MIMSIFQHRIQKTYPCTYETKECVIRTCADELAKAFNMTFDEFVEMHDGDYGIISDHCRDHLYDERRPTVKTDVCAEPACRMRVSITELNRNEGLWCDNCA